MARIRTIKPEFFTSEDIVALSPLARLLYQATWCEADKEGRLVWKPRTFKLRYFPADNCDIEAMCDELVQAGLVVLYGDGLAFIPKFSKHQHINPRESNSSLPAPDESLRADAGRNASARVTTRHDASARDSDAQGGREGKGINTPLPPSGGEPAVPVVPPGFVRFWDSWPKSPRKGGKSKCLTIWRRAKLEAEADSIVAHVLALRALPDWTKQNGEFIPAPEVYLNGRRWDGAELGTQRADVPWAGAL